jgi:UDP-4-amino-4,6-dideoxy-N-acetyl-beta-L-altrosamine transaminase
MSLPNIPYGRQSIDEADIKAVTDVLRSDWLTQGPYVERFELEVAQYCGAGHGVALNSATSALHLACLAAGLGPGDLLWTSPITFVASANCALYCGARVDFVDIDPRSGTMSADELERKLVAAAHDGCLPKVVLPVHFAGQSCDMLRIGQLAQEYGFTVIEDAAHAVGGSYQGRRIGCCDNSAMTVFSFHPVKLITSGEGGMVVTNSPDLCQRIVRLRSHGVTRDPDLMSYESHGSWYYEQVELGYNYRMTDIQAALGVSQLGRLDAFVARRHSLAERYRTALCGLPLEFLWQLPDGHSAYHLFVIRLLPGLPVGRRQVVETLRARGILANVHYIPVHTQPYYRTLGFGPGDFPQAENYYAGAMTLPLYPGLTDEEQDYVIAVLKEVLL